MQLHHTGKHVSLKEGDLEILEKLRERFKDRQAGVLSWKFDLAPLHKEFPGLIRALKRLWANDIIVRFSSQFHTVHGSAEYIKYYIWEGSANDKGDAGRSDTRAPGYIV